jgi:hypothetical protein
MPMFYKVKNCQKGKKIDFIRGKLLSKKNRVHKSLTSNINKWPFMLFKIISWTNQVLSHKSRVIDIEEKMNHQVIYV